MEIFVGQIIDQFHMAIYLNKLKLLHITTIESGKKPAGIQQFGLKIKVKPIR